MGLLEMFSGGSDDPQSQARIASAIAMLNMGGPSTTRTTFGQAMGAGVMAGNAAAQAYKDRQREEEYRKQQLAHQALISENLGLDISGKKSAMERQNALRQLDANFAKQSMAGQQPEQYQPQQEQAPLALSQGANGSLGFSSAPTQQQGQQAPQMRSQAQGQTLNRADEINMQARKIMDRAKLYQDNGFGAEAAALQESAIKLLGTAPKYSTDFRKAKGEDGKMHNYVLADDGTWKDTGLGVEPKLRELNLSDRVQLINDYDVTPGQTFKMGISPTTAAQNSLGWARLNFDKEQAAAPTQQEAMFSPETLKQMAEQYRSGDNSVFVGLGRGAQGAANIAALRKEITAQNMAAGVGGADQAAKNAEYFGTKAGQRAAGTRIANVEMASTEAAELIPLARDASHAVARSGLLPFGKGQVMFNEQTNNPAMRQFAAANNSLINVYARAISPTGVGTVADKEHAREMLNTAMDQRSYDAVLDQMNKEITAARRAPKAVRQAFNEEVTGKGHSAQPQAQAQAPANQQKSRIVKLDGGGSAMAKLASDGKYYIEQNGKKFRVEE